MILRQEIDKKIKANAICLEKFGINELAWKKATAEELILSLMQEYVGILGGDVYKILADNIESLYDNWSCEPRKGESKAEFILRSKLETLNYIEQYSIQYDANVVFVIVFTENYIC